jgi:hypothetical protein
LSCLRPLNFPSIHGIIERVMENKNFDGIKYSALVKPQKVIKTHSAKRLVRMDDVRRPTKRKLYSPYIRAQYTVPVLSVVSPRPKQRYFLPVATFVIILAAFLGGMNFALRTPKSVAENTNAIAASTTPGGMVADLGNAPSSTAPTTLSNADLYNTPLEVLQSYFQVSQSDQVLAQRKIQLKQFLTDHNSPLVDVSDTIAEQPHWQLILAISFAESTLGKKCFEFNCSGIGGANIRSYKSFDNWILDFNRLLDKRYNNWTLDEMCGVYVQPCTNNWLSATGQILDELKQGNIN